MSTATGAEAAPDALLLTGPLGAGKTTLLERSLLPALAGRRVVVLVNDAGAAPLDALLLGKASVPVLGVAGGCFCCHAGGRLLDALALIRDRMAPELLILEGSGLSPPGPLAAALQGEGFRLLGTIGVLAAAQLERLPRDPLARAQLAAAGMIVVTGADRLDRAGFEAARRALAGLTRGPILPAFEGRLRAPLEALLAPGLGAPPAGEGALHAHARTLRLAPAGLPRRGELAAWLAAAPPGVLRVKGIVQCAEHACPIAVNHALGETDVRPLPRSGEPDGLWIVHEGEPPAAWLGSLPHGLDPADWAALDPLLLPLGEADAREGAAFLDSRRAAPLEAAEAFLARLAAAERPVLVTAAPARAETAARWAAAIASVAALDDARCAAIDAAIDALDADLLLLAGLPDAFAERIARGRPSGATLHLARRFALPAPGVSLGLSPRARGSARGRGAGERRTGRDQPKLSGSGQTSPESSSNVHGQVGGSRSAAACSP